MVDAARISHAIGVAQFAPTADQQVNLTIMRALAVVAVERGAQLVVFPEYSSYFESVMGARSVAAAEDLEGPFVAALGSLARELGVAIVAGMLERTPGARRASNTAVAVDASGATVAIYRKQHLYDAFGQTESDFILAGDLDAPQTFVVGDLTIGIQTCYDLRFPEVTRRLVDAGADVVVVPSEWVRGPLKEHHWRTLVTARAIENTVYVAAADHAPPIGAGNSMIVDPFGVELVTVGDESAVAVAWVSRDRIDSVREINPALSLRRFGVVPL